MAGSSSSRIACLATLVMTGILFSGKKAVVTACQGDVRALKNQCEQFVGKSGPVKDPSKSCCDVVKKTDFRCLCGIPPSGIWMILSRDKVIHVANSCGIPIPAGFKCG